MSNPNSLWSPFDRIIPRPVAIGFFAVAMFCGAGTAISSQHAVSSNQNQYELTGEQTYNDTAHQARTHEIGGIAGAVSAASFGGLLLAEEISERRRLRLPQPE